MRRVLGGGLSRARFKTVGFYDPDMHQTPPARRWSRTSPQHVDWASLQRLLPAELLDEVFTVVRHPVSRIVSAYHFQVEVEKAVAPDTSLSDWLAAQARAFEADPFTIDNHFRPQVDFIPEGGCRVFHLEHGLEAIVPYLDGIAAMRMARGSCGITTSATASGQASCTSRAERRRPAAYRIALFQRFHPLRLHAGARSAHGAARRFPRRSLPRAGRTAGGRHAAEPAGIAGPAQPAPVR